MKEAWGEPDRHPRYGTYPPHTMKRRFLIPLLWVGAAALASEPVSAPAVVIRLAESRITATDTTGRRVADAAAGRDDGAVLQAVIDASGRGSKVTLSAGRYVLTRPLRVDRSCLIEGEGRGTVLVPPSGDFAIRVVKTEASPMRSELSRPEDGQHTLSLESHLYHVTLRDLCVDGEGQGKGIFFERVFDATLQRVFIMRTGDGAGLFLGGFVMEAVFDDVVVHGCGNFERKEAAIVVAAQASGDASNNLRFRAVEVIFPRYNAVMIGAGEGTKTPRLVFFQQCFFHGQLPFEKLPACDLIHIARSEGRRGVVTFTDCRITNVHPEHALVRVGDARVTLSGCVLGGGPGRAAIRCEPSGKLIARGNTFHDDSPKIFREFALEADGGEISFNGNVVDSARGNRISLTAVRSAIVTDNRFAIESDHPTVRLADRGAEGCRNVVIANNSFMEPRVKCAIECGPHSTERIEIHGNIYGGTYARGAVIRP